MTVADKAVGAPDTGCLQTFHEIIKGTLQHHHKLHENLNEYGRYKFRSIIILFTFLTQVVGKWNAVFLWRVCIT